MFSTVYLFWQKHSHTTDRFLYLKCVIPCNNCRACQEKKKATATKPSEQKRTRRDRKDLENILFKLFERQANWSLKHLMQETDQPEVFCVRLLEAHIYIDQMLIRFYSTCIYLLHSILDLPLART
jgi:hypothetical protein